MVRSNGPRALRRGRQPDWTTPLGGGIGLHGGGNDRDWTAGCIALTNETIGELDAILRLGDPIEILPSHATDRALGATCLAPRPTAPGENAIRFDTDDAERVGYRTSWHCPPERCPSGRWRR